MTHKPKRKKRVVLAEYDPFGPPHYNDPANCQYFIVAATKNLLDEDIVGRRFRLILEEM